MKPIVLTYIDRSVKRDHEIFTLTQLFEFCKEDHEFDPPIENQLCDFFVEDYMSFYPGDKGSSYVVSCELNGTISCGVVKTLNDLLFVVHNVRTTPKCSFYPPLNLQLKEGGGWNEDRIRDYNAFVKQVQQSLPKDYRLTLIENKIDEFLNFWNVEASQADLSRETILSQLVELKRVVF